MVIMILVGGYVMVADSSASITRNVVRNSGSGDVQEVVLGMKNYNYFPETIEVNSGQPVRVRMDSSAQGCFRDFTIRALGVKKYLANVDDYVEFTPNKPGTYTFSCSMGMGLGTLIVE